MGQKTGTAVDKQSELEGRIIFFFEFIARQYVQWSFIDNKIKILRWNKYKGAGP